MFNYYENIVWNIDKILLGLSILFSIVLVVYALIISYAENKRRRNLLAIKKNVHALAMSGQKPDGETCPAVETKTPQGFLDVEMGREQVLFDEPEKQFIRKCFASPEKIALAREMAKEVKNKWRRIEALLSLGYAQDTPSLDIMKEAALGKDEDVAYYSLLALGLIKNVESAKVLLGFLKNNVSRPSKIASILETFPPTIVDEAAKLMDDTNPSVRLRAINLVVKFRGEQYVKKIEELTKDTSTDVRATACGSLGGFGKRESKDALLKCLKDKSSIVRMNAVESLSKLAGDETMGEIGALIKEDSLLVRGAVKTAMAGHIDVALPFIEKILSGDDELAKKEAVEALEISGYTTKLLKNIISDDVMKRAEAVNLLKLMIKARAHFGIEAALSGLGKTEFGKVMEALQTIDKPFAEHAAKKIRQEIAEL